MTQAIGYLNAVFVRPLSRGATQWAPGMANVPPATRWGVNMRYPGGRSRLTPTLFSLTTQGGAAGFPFQTPIAGFPLSANPYDTGGS
jgi:hypothetical protein